MGTIQATEEVGTGLILSTKSVAKGVIMGISDVGGDLVSVAGQTVKGAVKGAAEIGADVGLVARRAVDGVIEATKEVGGNVEEVAKVAVGGAIEAAGSIGNTAVRSVKDMLVGVVEGVKEVASSILPKGSGTSSASGEAETPPRRKLPGDGARRPNKIFHTWLKPSIRRSRGGPGIGSGGLYRSEGLKQDLTDRLKQDGEVYTFSVNILTGNVLVRFNGHRTATELEALLRNLVRNFQERNGIRAGRERKASLYPVFFPHPRPADFKPEPSEGEPRHPLAPVFSQKIKTSPRKVRQLVVHSEDQPAQPWHFLEAHDLLEQLESHSALGLSRSEALSRLKKYGPNVLPESVPRSGFSIFIDQFKSLPVALLGVAAAISVATAGIADAVVIAAVVLINAVIGYVTESQAERTINSLKTLVRPQALVVRDGAAEEIPAEEVIPGDVLVLRPGTYVTADARLIEAHHLTIDKSALTGESLPVSKTTEMILTCEQVSDRGLPQMEVPLGDRTNMVYMGTLVTGGQGLALVVATGRFTEIGRIQLLVGESQTPETPMERQLNTMGTQLVLISGAVCGLVFVIGLLRGYGFLQMLKSSISLAVAAVPEGLPTVATTTLGLGLRRMRKYNVLIRHLDAVETLGSVQTICMDKTGTLTLNRMSVVMLNVGMRLILLEKEQFKQGQEVLNPYVWPELLQLMHIAILCNESEVTPIVPDADVYQQKTKEVQGKGLAVFQNGNVFVSGSPTENALIHMALAAGVNIPSLREQFPLEKTALRTETRNYMITLHRTSRDGQRVAAVKGSPRKSWPSAISGCGTGIACRSPRKTVSNWKWRTSAWPARP